MSFEIGCLPAAILRSACRPDALRTPQGITSLRGFVLAFPISGFFVPKLTNSFRRGALLTASPGYPVISPVIQANRKGERFARIPGREHLGYHRKPPAPERCAKKQTVTGNSNFRINLVASGPAHRASRSGKPPGAPGSPQEPPGAPGKRGIRALN